MKLPFYLSILILGIAIDVHSQVNFEPNLGWPQILEKAQKEQKLIFLHLEDSKCVQCNEVASQGFSSSMMKEKFAVNFVSLRVNAETAEGKELGAKYELKGFPVSLFLDAEGNMLHRYNGSTSAAPTYMQHADIALSKRYEKPLSFYEKEYKAGNRAPEFLEAYIIKRKSTLMNVQDLLEEYADGLPTDSLTNFRIVKFIYNQGPSLDNRAYKRVRAIVNPILIDSLYRSVPLTQAVAMNNQIINASLQKAIQKKDFMLMQEVAGFARGTYGKDRQKGQNAYTQNFLKYYYAVKDTQNYIRTASYYYDERHMRISIDSLKQMDQRVIQDRLKSRNVGDNPPVGIPNVLTREMVSISPPSQFFHIELNQAAFYFWELATKPDDLEKALLWSKRSMELFSELNVGKNSPLTKGNPSYLDTYARLLYKLNRKEEAIEWQIKAIEAQKVTGQSYRHLEEILEKIKTGKL
ncbi:thioredoxin family protein [Runella aurantiaca]|uniref:DUF255 domain-containing protein n=1 Tax=Runella aurantiaca TaxID=2282308 RepID=A0A369HYC6_9BACT|nr:thioredoxin family protein [Runella aurantiaca]RDB02348.1 hypothetical protein DVG78_29165 [Runella aurantiaca]